MRRTDIWHQLHLFGRKIALLLLLLSGFTLQCRAQLNYQEFANKRLYFGITLGYNQSDFKIVHSEDFIYNNEIKVVNSTKGPGFNLGIISNLKFGEYFDMRFIPALSFAEKNLNYTHFGDSTSKRTIESIYLDFPVSIRFKSQPFRDVRLYVMAGMKYSLDFASNAEKRKADDQVTVIMNDVSFEYGFGIQIFFPLFIFSPEIKISHGLFNVHHRNPELIHSNVLDKLLSRTFLFSIHFEG